MAKLILLDSGPLGMIAHPKIIATTNTKHLSRFAEARIWDQIV